MGALVDGPGGVVLHGDGDALAYGQRPHRRGVVGAGHGEVGCDGAGVQAYRAIGVGGLGLAG